MWLGVPVASAEPILDDSPHWYKTAVIYQVHVRSFADRNGDGIGDFPGLTERLDYIEELGATAVWVLPFYPSPLRDGGYDIADYTGIHPDYGTMRDFKRFVTEAHRRGLRVITEVVINHTSDQHAWFQRARRAKPGSKWRDFYVWSRTNQRYTDARIIFTDFESSNWTWDTTADAYFWHRFYSHQPDLNFDNLAVHDAVLRVVDFWLGMGVDGLRLDAIPYLYEREGTSCENLPETHAFLKKLRAHVDAKFPNRMLLAEANQWPEDTRAYFGDGDECHMAFNFPVMPRMYMAVQMEDRYPLVDIIGQTPDIPDNAQWALFLRNHDELTLEMVTDEERDYMYRVYAADQRARINLGIRRRLAPLLHNDRERIELLNGLLLSLPGTPIIYYGDEIGMGDNIYLGDRDGVRTPMQWSADRNAGFSTANPQKLFLPVNIDPEYRYEAVNVASQERIPNSLLLWMRRLIRLRQQHPVFGSGDIEFLLPENSRVLCFLRTDSSETILVVANLSRHAQYVELDLAEYEGATPVELFGGTAFPPIGQLPYLLTLGPHSFYWFRLTPRGPEEEPGPGGLPAITTATDWGGLFGNKRSLAVLESALPAVVANRRWFGGKDRRIADVAITTDVAIPLGGDREPARILLVDVSYTHGEPETYVLPVTFLAADAAEEFLHDHPGAGLVRVAPRGAGGLDGVICDAMAEERFTLRLLDILVSRRRIRSNNAEVRPVTTGVLRALIADVPDGEREEWMWPSLHRGEQTNTTAYFGEALALKLFRRSEPGANPDWELGRFLTERAGFPDTPAMAGALELRTDDGPVRTLAVLQEVVRNEGDGWTSFLHQLGGFYEQLPAVGRRRILQEPLPDLFSDGYAPGLAEELFGAMLGQIDTLADCTARLHIALASDTIDEPMRPQRFTPHYQRSLYQSIRNQVSRSLGMLRRRCGALSPDSRQLADELLRARQPLEDSVNLLKDLTIDGLRMRIHGDYHLGQVLFTGRQFVIIDFEGEPARSLSVRRLKRSPLRDVAGMLRSLDYAAQVSAADYCDRFNVRRTSRQTVQHAAAYWSAVASAQFLGTYLQLTSDLLVQDEQATQVLLRAFLIEKAAYELEYEMNNRPEWLPVPMRGLLALAGKRVEP
jgi:maltose alpha-D-glucosyltransferase/alpha-amylase